MNAADDVLRVDAPALERLTTSDRETWQRLIAHASTSKACPPELTRALLAIDDFDGWLRRLFSAYNGLNPDDGMGADFEFRRWFSAGITRAFPATDRRVLEARHREALRDESAGATASARELVVTIERAGGAPDLLGRAYLLLARRLSEDLDQDAAIAAARSAENLFAELGNETWRTEAVRMRGAALLRARKIDEALAALDTLGDSPSSSCASCGAHRAPPAVGDPIDAVLYRAGAIAAWASNRHAEWLLALDRIARATGHRECARRAAAGPDGVVDEDAELPRQMR